MPKLVTPYHYRVYERSGTRWFVLDAAKVFYNSTNQPLELQEIEQQFGLIAEQVIIELFRINAGRQGYYLANLQDQRYYYCGPNFEDVKKTLQSLGVGRTDRWMRCKILLSQISSSNSPKANQWIKLTKSKKWI